MTCELRGGKTIFAIVVAMTNVVIIETIVILEIIVIAETIETTLSVSVINESHDVRMTALVEEEKCEKTMDELTTH